MNVLPALWLAASLYAQQNQNFDNIEIHVLPVQGSVYMLLGAGGNTTVQAGKEGALVVDTQYEEVSDKIVAEIRKLTSKPIRYIINTSADMDHTDGNAKISRAGAPVIGGNLGAVAFDNGATIVALNEQSATRIANAETNYVLKMGVSLRLLEKATETLQIDINWLTPQEMRDYNVVNTE